MRTPFCVLALVIGAGASNRGEPISVDVTEVRRVQNDSEASEKGSWVHLTAEVETETIAYSLKCDEFYSTPNYKFAMSCVHLSAGKDYSGLNSRQRLAFGRRP